MTSLRSLDVETCLGRLRVRVGGRGPALLFWPSLLMSASMWDAQAQYFGGRFQVVSIDPPGHGDSEALRGTFGFAQCAQCVVQVLDALDIARTHYVGNSWGGMIGATFVALHPDRAGAAVLMNCTGSAAGLRQKLEYAVLIRLVRMLGGIPPWLDFVPVRAFVGPTSERERPQAIAAIRAAMRRVDGHSVHWAIRSVVPERPDQRDLLGTIRTPVLVLAGAEDRTFAVEETRAMAAAIPGAEFRVIDGLAHLAGLEAPDLVNRIVDDFLARAQRAAA